MERKNVITMKGNPMTLVGPELKVGDAAPAFTVVDKTLKPVTLADYAGKVKVISVTPSLDTPVCDLQATWFNEDTAEMGDVYVLNISMDLPFALGRYCAAKGFDKVATLSERLEFFNRDNRIDERCLHDSLPKKPPELLQRSSAKERLSFLGP